MIKGNLNDTIEFKENIKIKKALEWLKSNKGLDTGVYEIDGKDIYAIVQSYNTKFYDSKKWEVHKKYIDIQFIEEGYEKIGVGNFKDMKEETEYNLENDIQFFEGIGEFVDMQKNDWLILFTDDLHMPCIGEGNRVKKIVIKVSV